MSELHDPTSSLPAEVNQLWELNAPWWQEAFTEGADPEYEEQIIPLLQAQLGQLRPQKLLEVGCGEGQLCRVAARAAAQWELPAPGPLVVGADPTGAQLQLALKRQERAATAVPVELVRAEAAALPFPDAYFDAALACLVFEHIDDARTAIEEVGRVLKPGGAFLFFLNHPLLQAPGSGWVDDQILGEQYWRIGPYLVEHHSVEEVAKDVWIPFVHRPLSFYVNAMADAGMYVTSMAEPAPPEGFLKRASEYQEAAAFPRLAFLRAEKLVLRPSTAAQ
ncbi:MAG: class I SAM-dependent methyltransferase [Acidimicrobiales bacterium]